MTTANTQRYISKSYRLLEKKQKTLEKWYKLGTFDRFFYDQEYQTLQLINDEAPYLEFKSIVIGSYADDSESWMWGWSNASFQEDIRIESEVFKEISKSTEIKHFLSPSFVCDEFMAYELAAMCVRHIDALGMYKIPGENSTLFLALTETK